MVGRIAKMRVRMGGESKSARGFLFSQIKDNCQFCGVLFDEPNLLYSIGLLLGSRAKLVVKPKTIFFVLTNALFLNLDCTEN